MHRVFAVFQGYHVPLRDRGAMLEKGLNPHGFGVVLAVLIRFIRQEAAVWGL